MNKPRLSVIVPVYKVEKYIHNCVDSILNQTFSDFEVILVDDGSPDRCGEICDSYASLDKRIKVIHQSNGGLSAARNKGIEIARGEIIGFVDSDDEISADMYEKMLQYLDDNQLDIVCADTYSVKNEKKTFRPRYPEDKLFSRDEAINEILTGRLDNAAPNKIFKRSVIGEIRFPFGRVYEDVATVYRYIYRSKKVGYMCQPYYYYYKRPGSITKNNLNSKGRYDCFCGYKERVEFAEQHQLPCLEQCKVQALETALSTLTAFYAMNERTDSEKYLDVTAFIRNHSEPRFISQLSAKHRFLIYCFQHCPSVYKSYAFLSAWSKRL